MAPSWLACSSPTSRTPAPIAGWRSAWTCASPTSPGMGERPSRTAKPGRRSQIIFLGRPPTSWSGATPPPGDPHPPDRQPGARRGHRRERHLLMPVRALADVVIDTSTSPSTTCGALQEKMGGHRGTATRACACISFPSASKYGSPNRPTWSSTCVFSQSLFRRVHAPAYRPGPDVAAYVLDNDEEPRLPAPVPGVHRLPVAALRGGGPAG